HSDTACCGGHQEEASSNTTFQDVETLLQGRNTSIPFSWRPHNVLIKLAP
ncbi:hypothetical protein A2U01_0030555, partial [Trifolium medium]|nr:hypothetical protein [Trifolium medium]